MRGRDVDAISLCLTNPTNTVTGTIKLARTPNVQFEEWNGTAWVPKIIAPSGGGTGSNNLNDFKASLGLGTMAYQNSNAVNITGGNAIFTNLASAVTTIQGTYPYLLFLDTDSAVNNRRAFFAQDGNTFFLNYQSDDALSSANAQVWYRNAVEAKGVYIPGNAVGFAVAPTFDTNCILQLVGGTGVSTTWDTTFFGSNIYFTTGNWRYFSNGPASMWLMVSGATTFYTAPSNAGGPGAVAAINAICAIGPSSSLFNNGMQVNASSAGANLFLNGRASDHYSAILFRSNAGANFCQIYCNNALNLEFWINTTATYFMTNTALHANGDATHQLGLTTKRWLYVNAAYCSCNTGGGFIWDQNYATTGIIRGASGTIEHRNTTGAYHFFFVGGVNVGGFTGGGAYVGTGNIVVPPGPLNKPSYGFVNEQHAGMTMSGTGTGSVVHLCVANTSLIDLMYVHPTFGVSVVRTKHIIPQSQGDLYLGYQNPLSWYALYAVTGTIQASDARDKEILGAEVLGLDFINRIEAVQYKWKTGPSRKVRHGVVAQQVEEVLNELEVEFGGLDVPETPNAKYGFNYSELIGPLIKAIQELNEKVEEIKNGRTRA